MIMMTLLWVVSVIFKNVSIVDLFWGLGFVLASGLYFLKTGGYEPRKVILIVLVSIWGIAYQYISHGGTLVREKIFGTNNSGRTTERKDTGG
jgi:steroid 5-alpha reductase family enzyme